MPEIVLPDPPLTDGVVTLRAFTRDDIAAVTEACQDPEIARWTSQIPSPYTLDDARAWIAGHDNAREAGIAAPFAVVDAAASMLLGACGLDGVDAHQRTAEIGYWTAAPARRRGAATRAVVLLSCWAIAGLGMERIVLHTFPGNVASEGVAAKAGFTREALLRSYLPVRGELRDVTCWSLVRSDLDGE